MTFLAAAQQYHRPVWDLLCLAGLQSAAAALQGPVAPTVWAEVLGEGPPVMEMEKGMVASPPRGLETGWVTFVSFSCGDVGLDWDWG